ncbi:MAG: segregation/condensation protein A [Xanthobacteraceae bacterium]|nr:segregation/condensation protein A [Xanthobacteraceae bacterium]
MLARTQKVDLAKISILALADQYLEFIQRARDLRIEVAADYLVMAAWLAYLKSRLLLPEPAGPEEPSAADLAADLAARLQHLEAIRRAGAGLMTRDKLGTEFFMRGAPEETDPLHPQEYTATIYDLLSAYAVQRQKKALARHTVKERVVWSLKEARDALERLVGVGQDWARLDSFLIEYLVEPEMHPTVLASSFSASLEMVKEGHLELQQERAFAPLWLKRRPEPRPELQLVETKQ